jgi:hypothetical protein
MIQRQLDNFHIPSPPPTWLGLRLPYKYETFSAYYFVSCTKINNFGI